MKNIVCLILCLNVCFAWSQVGIGTTDPQEALEVQGSIRMVDGNEQKNQILVSDSDGTGSWTNVNDGVRTRIIRQINGGPSTEVTLWTHPEGIIVLFNPATEVVTVENNTGDANSVYWNIATIGGGESTNTTQTAQYNFRFINNGASFTHDLTGGSQNRGLFTIIASDQNNQLDGFVMNIVFYDDDINGMVQYWDN